MLDVSTYAWDDADEGGVCVGEPRNNYIHTTVNVHVMPHFYVMKLALVIQ